MWCSWTQTYHEESNKSVCFFFSPDFLTRTRNCTFFGYTSNHSKQTNLELYFCTLLGVAASVKVHLNRPICKRSAGWLIEKGNFLAEQPIKEVIWLVNEKSVFKNCWMCVKQWHKTLYAHVHLHQLDPGCLYPLVTPYLWPGCDRNRHIFEAKMWFLWEGTHLQLV